IPTFFEDHSLEDRAIPYYYRATELSRCWNFRLHSMNRDAFIYSRNAALYSNQASALTPLAFQSGRYSFYRIEGHLGIPYQNAENQIQTKIAEANLPFVVKS